MKKEYKVMDEQARLDFGIQIADKYITKLGYRVVFINNDLDEYPDMVAEKDGKRYGFVIGVDEYHTPPKISVKQRFYLLRSARMFNMVPIYVSIGLKPQNEEIAKKRVLIDDPKEGFTCEHFKMYIINLDIDTIPPKDTKDYIEYVVHTLGICHETKDISLIIPFLDENVKFSSIFEADTYTTKKDVIDYFNKKFSLMSKDQDVRTDLIQFVGRLSSSPPSSVKFSFGNMENVRIRMLQPDGEIGLIVVEDLFDVDKMLVYQITFNENHLISKIRVNDQFLSNFKPYYKSNNKEI